MIFKGQFKWQKLKIYKYIQSNSPLFLPVFLTLSFTLSLSFILPLFRAQMKTLCLSGSKENLSDFFSLNSFGTESSLWKSSWGSFTDPHWTVLTLLAVLPSPPPNVHRSSRLGGRKGVIFRVCRTGGWEFLRVRRREPQAALWGPWELYVSCFYLQPWPPPCLPQQSLSKNMPSQNKSQCRDFPVGQWWGSHLPRQRRQVRSLVGELGSHIPWGK